MRRFRKHLNYNIEWSRSHSTCYHLQNSRRAISLFFFRSKKKTLNLSTGVIKEELRIQSTKRPRAEREVFYFKERSIWIYRRDSPVANLCTICTYESDNNFCAIQLDAHKDSIKYHANLDAGSTCVAGPRLSRFRRDTARWTYVTREAEDNAL